MADAAIPYEEPSINTILIQSSFLLLSNTVNTVLDHVVYCGLVGQIFLGMAWGTPGWKLLSRTFEQTATQLGYLGLIFIVFEGGLATSVKSVQKNLVLSVCVAATGILLPISFSFSLLAIADASNLQAFAAGAALCSTSLGTTFSLLKTTGLTTTRLGVVLTSAAMLDDVVGLIMVQVITNLGSQSGRFTASTLLRPIFVSLGFAILLPIFCKFVISPALKKWYESKSTFPRWWESATKRESISFLFPAGVLVAFVSAASYAGTSALFASYLAGALLAWIDEQIVDGESTSPSNSNQQQSTPAPETSSDLVRSDEGTSTAHSDTDIPRGTSSATQAKESLDNSDNQPSSNARLPTPPPEKDHTMSESAQPAECPEQSFPSEGLSMRIYNQYYIQAVDRILKPLLFGSIGFAIPITKMFRGTIVWRGIVYAILMAVGKLCCGLWLVRFTTADPSSRTETSDQKRKIKGRNKKGRNKALPRPKSLYPAWLLGCAMVARGEIGFLISALAASNGIFTADGDNVQPTSEIYLIVTWAILLCTILGPIALGLLAKRVKRLQKERDQNGDAGIQDPLGTWGIG
ncbi:uncharacterized protein PV06_08772 [Exophiala oligosperma]|uniref:Cation/H+ exchanger transmembrane domain-containing protein n=2 Tax=Chaetothyriales TaxID=34395 RepID=A0A0D2BN74_9EURO|nr:uncharacterized protein PV06_08772 [Exophiala oligosperma]KAJ9644938.1 hypothetical protein H2204_001400 [Knufia peltigerae]KIW38952.1 hypothetical protein PV06_08772 [Exophiala oligosperma]